MGAWPARARFMGLAIVAVAALVTVTLLSTFLVLTLRASVTSAAQGWYLLLPPTVIPSESVYEEYKRVTRYAAIPQADKDEMFLDLLVGKNLPLTDWLHLTAFNTVGECEEAHVRLAGKFPALSPEGVIARHARCVASDDPRLK